jgi:hypothetical protein
LAGFAAEKSAVPALMFGEPNVNDYAASRASDNPAGHRKTNHASPQNAAHRRTQSEALQTAFEVPTVDGAPLGFQQPDDGGTPPLMPSLANRDS